MIVCYWQWGEQCRHQQYATSALSLDMAGKFLPSAVKSSYKPSWQKQVSARVLPNETNLMQQYHRQTHTLFLQNRFKQNTYVNFHNLTRILTSQSEMQFSFLLTHTLNNSGCGWECTAVLQCLSCKIYTRNSVIVREMIPLYYNFGFHRFKPHVCQEQVFTSRNPTLSEDKNQISL